MDFWDKIKSYNVLKIAGVIFLFFILVIFFLRLAGSSVTALLNKTGLKNITSQSVSYDSSAYNGGYAVKGGSPGEMTLSLRNASNYLLPKEETAMGDDAENYEVTQYSARIETRVLKDTCFVISSLKAKDYVIFENSNEYDRGCNYIFKVKKPNAEEILDILKGLDPKDLSENIYTIKNTIEDFTSEKEILMNKLASLDETLDKAMKAYDEVSSIATKVKDVESLAKIIDSKINIIERLTQERININSQLDRLEREKALQLDRLEYTSFNVNIVENKFIDGENIKDSWFSAIKEFVTDINKVTQDISVNLLTLCFMVFQYFVYVIILVLVAKYGWQLIKYIWNK